MNANSKRAPTNRFTPFRPGPVTSIGVLASLALGALNLASQNGGQVEAQRRTDIAEANLKDSIRHIWDSVNKDRDSNAAARDRLRADIETELRRDIDAHCRGIK